MFAANLLYRVPVLAKLAWQPYKLLPRGTPLPIPFGYGRGLRFCWQWIPTFNLGVFEYPTQEVLGQALSFRGRQDAEDSGAVFYDVGANEGFFSVLASRLVGSSGQVVAFEPHPESAHHIRRNLQVNSLHPPRVLFYQKAVGDTGGTARLISQGHAMSHLASAEGLSQPWTKTQSRYVQSGRIYEVELTTLDTVVEQGGRLPNVVKIDAEGAEVAVLRGARGVLESNPPVILCEFHSPATAAAGGELLREYGYSFYEIGGAKGLRAIQSPSFWTLALPSGNTASLQWWRPGSK